MEKIHSLHHPQNMKEMGGHAEEIQTNTAMFASQIPKKKEGNCKHRYANNHTEGPGSLAFPRLCHRVTLRDTLPQSYTEGHTSQSYTEGHTPTKLGQTKAGVESHGCPKGRTKYC